MCAYHCMDASLVEVHNNHAIIGPWHKALQTCRQGSGSQVQAGAVHGVEQEPVGATWAVVGADKATGTSRGPGHRIAGPILILLSPPSRHLRTLCRSQGKVAIQRIEVRDTQIFACHLPQAKGLGRKPPGGAVCWLSHDDYWMRRLDSPHD